jgi:uncharacterized membrane protein
VASAGRAAARSPRRPAPGRRAQAPLVCGVRGPIDCERVLTSGYAQLAGTSIPTSAAGLAWFAVSGVLAAVQLVRPLAWIPLTAGLAWSLAGILAALALVYVEIVVLGAICAWCTGAHLLVLLTLLLTLARMEHVRSAEAAA